MAALCEPICAGSHPPERADSSSSGPPPNCFQYSSWNGLILGPIAFSFTRCGGNDCHHSSYAASSCLITSGCVAATSVVSPASFFTSKSCHCFRPLPADTRCQRLVRTLQFAYLYSSTSAPFGQRPTCVTST